MSAREPFDDLPWGSGGSGAPDGDSWVWSYSPIDPETGASECDSRVFHAPPEIAAEVVRRVNAFPDLLAALEAYIGATVEQRTYAYGLATAAIAKARGQ